MGKGRSPGLEVQPLLGLVHRGGCQESCDQGMKEARILMHAGHQSRLLQSNLPASFGILLD